MRALLIINPRASSMTSLRREVIVGALASAMDVKAVETHYRGHARSLAAEAVTAGCDVVVCLGGDGTVNEVINGLASAPHPGRPGAAALPALAPIPGGNANVFTRALGLPADPVEATGRILAAISSGRSRSIGLGLAGRRYFACSAGLGIDGEVVRAMEGLRADGRKVSDLLYLWTTLRQFYLVTDRRHPAITLERPGHPPAGGVFLGMVSNTAPWTYLGQRPLNPTPLASFATGLDVFALRRLRTVSTLRVVRQMLSAGKSPPNGRHVLTMHDEPQVTLRSDRPVAMQVDGEYVGEHEQVVFRAVPDALSITV